MSAPAGTSSWRPTARPAGSPFAAYVAALDREAAAADELAVLVPVDRAA
jgi:hypothetical protein